MALNHVLNDCDETRTQDPASQLKKIVFTHRIVKIDHIDIINNSFEMQLQVFVRWKDPFCLNKGKKMPVPEST